MFEFLNWSGIHHLKRSWSSWIHQYAQVLCIWLSVWTTIKLRSHVVLKIFRYNPILRLLSLTHHNPAAVEHFLDFSKCSKNSLPLSTYLLLLRCKTQHLCLISTLRLFSTNKTDWWGHRFKSATAPQALSVLHVSLAHGLMVHGL